MPTLGICGDSFMSATVNLDNTRTDIKDSEGKHFTEILAKKIGYDYFTLARGACSNTAIRLQIDEMIKQRVDLVILGTTTSNRLELPKKGKRFDINLGVYNLDYRTEVYPDRSTLNDNFQHNFVTDTLTNIFYDPVPFIKKIFNDACNGHVPIIPPDQLLALEHFIDHLYDPDYKMLQDAWALHNGLHMLELANIPFICVWNLPSIVDFSQDHRMITSESELNFGNWEPGIRRWHTTDEAQELGAEKWYQYLIEHGYIRSQSV